LVDAGLRSGHRAERLDVAVDIRDHEDAHSATLLLADITPTFARSSGSDGKTVSRIAHFDEILP
jgi:hypothetical protein